MDRRKKVYLGSKV